MPSGQESALPSSSRYASIGLSPTITMRMAPTTNAATTAIRGNRRSRASLVIYLCFAPEEQYVFAPEEQYVYSNAFSMVSRSGGGTCFEGGDKNAAHEW